jgi:hypothetical protein
MKKQIFLLLCCLCAFARTNAATQFVFYLHGAIVEGSDGAPISQSFGRYEYHGIVKTLKQYGFVVISEIRPANTNAQGYAMKVAGQIDSLKKAGVASENIAVIGASKGAGIAMMASALVKDKKVKYVLMAGCHDGPGEDLYGQLLSIYEMTDGIAGSCSKVKKHSTGISKYKEIELETHLKHGFIYRPLKEWVEPAVLWIQK